MKEKKISAEEIEAIQARTDGMLAHESQERSDEYREISRQVLAGELTSEEGIAKIISI